MLHLLERRTIVKFVGGKRDRDKLDSADRYDRHAVEIILLHTEGKRGGRVRLPEDNPIFDHLAKHGKRRVPLVTYELTNEPAAEGIVYLRLALVED